MRRALAVAGALVLALAGVAEAHVSLDKTSVPANSDQSLRAQVPGEDPPAYNVKLILEIPAGFTAKSCSDKTGWTCAIKQDTTNGRSAIITWTRQSGIDAIDFFDFVVRTPNKNGDYPFEANQFYSNGEVVHWDGPADGDRPAPRLKVTGATTQPVKNTAAPATHAPITPAATVAPTSSPPAASAAPAPPGTGAATPSAASTPEPTGTPSPEAPLDLPTASPNVSSETLSEDDGLGAGPVVAAIVVLALGGGAFLLRGRLSRR